jgi:hypothetical protein
VSSEVHVLQKPEADRPFPALNVESSLTDATARDKAIRATIKASAGGRVSNITHRRTLIDRARLFTGFEHFRRLCLTDLREAFDESRTAGARHLKYRRLAWITFFRYVAKHHGIGQSLKITALDRQGHYTCELTPSEATIDNRWQKLIALSGEFGITEAEALCSG